MTLRRLLSMGLIGSLLILLGCAAPRLEDAEKQKWEEATRAAAATVLPEDTLEVGYWVDGGLSEMRYMHVKATVEADSTEELIRLADLVEAAVAPAVVGLPVKSAGLQIDLAGDASPRPHIMRTVLLDDLATRYGLPRGNP